MGADADITVLDFERQKPFMSMANGQVMYNGFVCGQGGKIITTAQGKRLFKKRPSNL